MNSANKDSRNSQVPNRDSMLSDNGDLIMSNSKPKSFKTQRTATA